MLFDQCVELDNSVDLNVGCNPEGPDDVPSLCSCKGLCSSKWLATHVVVLMVVMASLRQC